MRLVSVPMLALICFTASPSIEEVAVVGLVFSDPFIDVVVKFVDQQIQPVHEKKRRSPRRILSAAVPSPSVLVRHPARYFRKVHSEPLSSESIAHAEEHIALLIKIKEKIAKTSLKSTTIHVII